MATLRILILNGLFIWAVFKGNRRNKLFHYTNGSYITKKLNESFCVTPFRCLYNIYFSSLLASREPSVLFLSSTPFSYFQLISEDRNIFLIDISLV